MRGGNWELGNDNYNNTEYDGHANIFSPKKNYIPYYMHRENLALKSECAFTLALKYGSFTIVNSMYKNFICVFSHLLGCGQGGS